jgi:hypothetical protein
MIIDTTYRRIKGICWGAKERTLMAAIGNRGSGGLDLGAMAASADLAGIYLVGCLRTDRASLFYPASRIPGVER